ncbi:uncharacterized protein BXZ73DRAFT_106020 [Epithele typhae]|uniref:uncharacterized protein n=1 Tax=Epithele typhae TaxID=378194 RepID=UPI00200756EF|nr:uncharacterized protein BXZ73DRAFT_106020 [Epithele typhae]KAH9915954.1 hypothetical protein BXZ73DRAFT_106020 [Epithele typhae]
MAPSDINAASTVSIDVPVYFGPLFIAVMIDIFFYGIIVTQSFTYFTTFHRDPKWMKILVTLVLILDTLNSCFDVAVVYVPLVLKFGNISALLVTGWTCHMNPTVTGIVASLVQGFYAWRVHVIAQNRWIVGTICTLSFVQLLGSIGTTVAATRVPYIPDFPKLQSIVIVWLTSAVMADLLITSTLVHYLRSRRTGMEFTDTTINKITRLTIETGLLTAVWAVTDLLIYLTVLESVHLVFNFTLSKLYTFSLLTSLIVRHPIPDEASPEETRVHQMPPSNRVRVSPFAPAGMAQLAVAAAGLRPRRRGHELEKAEGPVRFVDEKGKSRPASSATWATAVDEERKSRPLSNATTVTIVEERRRSRPLSNATSSTAV